MIVTFIYPFIHTLQDFILPVYRYFYVTRAIRALQSHKLSGEGSNFGAHTVIHFWPHKDMEDLPRWGISSIPGPPPRQHEHERRDIPFTHPFILTKRIWKDDYDGQMAFGDLVGLKLPDIRLTVEENPEKTSPRKLVPTGIEHGPLRDRRECYRLLHSGGQLHLTLL